VVRDTGIGIRQEDKEKIFQMLGKLEATASINTSGVGLGLSTCKKIAEALQGDIFLVDDEESEENSLIPTTKSDKISSQNTKKVEGTAIALVLNCPEISAKFKVRRPDRRPNFESNEEKDSLLMYRPASHED
jgi:signal transduction histidine kinase